MINNYILCVAHQHLNKDFFFFNSKNKRFVLQPSYGKHKPTDHNLILKNFDADSLDE